jgi:hypothetical protein
MSVEIGDAGASSPPSDAQPSLATLSQILDWIAAQSRPARLPAGWEFISQSEKVRSFVAPGPQTLAGLRGQFGDSALLETGVVRRTSSGLTWAPVFGSGDAAFSIESVDGRPADVFSAWGRLSGSMARLIALAEARVAPSPPPMNFVFLTARDAEFVLLRSLGFDCASARRLERMTGANIKRLTEGSAAYHEPPVRFILPSFDLAGDFPSALNEPLIRHLAEADGFLNVDTGRLFRVWSGGKEVNRLRAAQRFGDQGRLRQIIFKGATEFTCSPAEAANRFQDDVPVDFSSAAKSLAAVIAKSKSDIMPHSRDAAEGVARLERAFREGVSNRLLAPVAEPFKQWANLLAAEAADRWLEGRADVRAAHSIASGHPPDSSSTDEDWIADRLKLQNLIRQMHRIASSGI